MTYNSTHSNPKRNIEDHHIIQIKETKATAAQGSVQLYSPKPVHTAINTKN